MDLSTLANIASVVSSLAVLVSLGYLALQMRQSARIQRSKMDRGRAEQVGAWLQHIAHADTAALILRGHACDPTLDAVECHRYLWSMYPLLLHFEDSYYQHRDGMLGDDQYASILGHLRSQSSTPGFRALWLHVRHRFPVEFAGFVDAVMREVAPSSGEISGWIETWKAAARQPALGVASATDSPISPSTAPPATPSP